MTTSGVYTATINGQQLIRLAMVNIGELDEDEDPSPRQNNDVQTVLNMMVSQWMGKADFAPGLKVWTRKHGKVFLSNTGHKYDLSAFNTTGWTNTFAKNYTSQPSVAGSNTLTMVGISGVNTGDFLGYVGSNGQLYWTTVAAASNPIVIAGTLQSGVDAGAQVYTYTTPAQYPVSVETALLRDDFGNDTPLRIMQVQAYDMLPSKVNPTYSGDPTAVYIENNLGFTSVYTDVATAQDVTKHIVLTYMEPVQKFVNPADTPYYPEEWFLALVWGLSEQICPMFKKKWTDKMEQLKNAAMSIARNKDGEVSVLFFQPRADD
jgi:hypothetical protein